MNEDLERSECSSEDEAAFPCSDSSGEPWDDDDTEEVRQAVLFCTTGQEYAFFTPKGDPVSFRHALTRADAAGSVLASCYRRPELRSTCKNE